MLLFIIMRFAELEILHNATIIQVAQPSIWAKFKVRNTAVARPLLVKSKLNKNENTSSRPPVGHMILTRVTGVW